MIDLRTGGVNGFSPDMTEWVSNQSYIRRNVFCLLIEAPLGFNDLEQSDYWIGTLRALVELHPLSITGLNATLTAVFAETPVGGAGQMQEDVTDVTESRSQIVFRWNEKYGMSINRFLRGWMTYLMMDPNSKVASINTLPGRTVTDMLADRTTATMIFIETDPTHTKVVKAWLSSNMQPKTTGDVTGSRDLTQPGEAVNYDVEFTGITVYNNGVNAFAQRLLNAINITGANPMNRAAWVDRIHADVVAQRKSYGQGIADLSAASVV